MKIGEGQTVEELVKESLQKVEEIKRGDEVILQDENKENETELIYYGKKDEKYHLFAGTEDWEKYQANEGVYTIVISDIKPTLKPKIHWFEIERDTKVEYNTVADPTFRTGFFDKVAIVDGEECRMVFIDGLDYRSAKGQSICTNEIRLLDS